MGEAKEPRTGAYEPFYRAFDSPLMRQVRREAYGEDIGQHSWVGAEELRQDIRRLGLSKASRLLDLGCGPCGPLTFVLSTVGCRGTGVELSPAALEVGLARAASLGVADRLTVRQVDLDLPLPFDSGAFDAAMSLDVLLHLRDRTAFFRDVARLLAPGGRFLLTDAGVVTGAFSDDELQKRALYGHTHFVPVGRNEALLESAGFRVIESEDRTARVLESAAGRLAALEAHRAELEQANGASEVARQRDYLETVIALSRRRALSRWMFLAEL